jgi:RNA polymerase sigma-70 factor (ECF subfamily)
MTAAADAEWERRVAETYRREAGRVLATLIRLLGSFDLAEEALHDAFTAALAQWPRQGLPRNPRAWLVSAGRFRTIDRLRRQRRFAAVRDELAQRIEGAAEDAAKMEPEELPDDSLRLIFTCCHPDLMPDAQVALTLREICGLTTEEIAAAFLIPTPTVAQRIVRAKSRIRDAGLPYEVPPLADLPMRLEPVLRVIYLVFNEGYASRHGPGLLRPELSGEAIRLGRLLTELLSDPEALGLLALMLLQDSRRAARLDAAGELVLLADQDRSLWDRSAINEARAILARVLAGHEYGAYTIQAAIAAEHARAATAEATDWGRIVELYNLLRVADPSPVVDLNRAAAVGLRDGPAAGIALIDAALEQGGLAGYAPAYTARAELHRRLGDAAAARSDYNVALGLLGDGPERRLVARRLRDLGPAP